MAYIIAKLLDVPWSETLHTSHILKNNYYRTFLAHIENAAFIRTICQETYDKLDRFLDYRYSKKIEMIHLGLKLVSNKKENSNKFIGRKNNKFEIVTPAILLPYKGHQYAILAAAELLKRGLNDFKWTFYGHGPLKGEIYQQIKKYNLSRNIILGGMIDNASLLLKYRESEFDLLVLSSISDGYQPEGIPVTIMEAMSHYIPVIATDNGGVPEILAADAGILIPQRDSTTLSNEIEKLMNDYERCIDLGKRGRERIEAQYNSMNNTRELINLYNKK